MRKADGYDVMLADGLCGPWCGRQWTPLYNTEMGWVPYHDQPSARASSGALLNSGCENSMLIVGYFDESGTHDSAPLSLMAGYIGDARQWRNFEKRARKLFARYRVDIFHSIDVKRSDKDFKGWTVDKKIKFLDELAFLCHDALESGFVSIISKDDYAKYYFDPVRQRKARPDSIYTLLVRASMSASVDAALHGERFRDGKEPSVNIVLESGHKNAGDALRVYREFERRHPTNSAQGALREPTFKSKGDCLPLAAADLLAYSAYSQETGAISKWVPKHPLKTENYRGNLYRIEIRKEQLDEFYLQRVEDRI